MPDYIFFLVGLWDSSFHAAGRALLPGNIWPCGRDPARRRQKQKLPVHAVSGRGRSSAFHTHAYPAVLTVEAALIVSMMLLLLGTVILMAVRLHQTVRENAMELAAMPLRYSDGLRPADLIHIGEFIQEWIPPCS